MTPRRRATPPEVRGEAAADSTRRSPVGRDLAGARLDHVTRERLQRTETLLAVSRAVGSTLDLTEIMRRVARETARALGADTVSAYVPDPRGTVLRPLAGYRVPKDRLDALARLCIPVKGHRLIVEAWETQAPVFSSDARSDARVDRELAHRFPLRSLLFVPLLRKGELMGGLLAVWWDRARALTPGELGLADGIGRQAALALENARLYEEAERGRREAEVIAELARTINASLDLDAILQRVTDGARALCGADMAQIALREPGSDAMVFRYWAGGDFDGYRTWRVEPGKGAGGQVLLTGRPFRTDDYAEDSRITKDYVARIREAGTVSELVAPIQVDGRIEGLLYVDNATRRPFTERDEAVLTRLAAHAAIATQNARVYEESEERRRLAEALLDVAGALGSTLELKHVLKIVAQRAAQVVGAERCSINLLREGHLVPVMSQFADGHAAPTLWAEFKVLGPFALDQVGAHGEAIRTKQPVVVEDAAASPLVPKRWVETFGVRSALVVPLVQKDTVIGTLNLDQSAGPHRWRPEQVELAMTVAKQAALAVNNARLLEELRTHRGRLEALLEVNRELARIQPLESVLERIAQACGQLLGTNSVGFRLLDGNELVVAATWGDAKQVMLTPRLKVGESLTGIAAATGEPVVAQDATRDPRLLPLHREALQRLGYRAWLALPVKVGQRLLGVLSVHTRRPQGFSPEDVELATAFASQAATALENGRLYAQAQEAYRELAHTQTQLLQSQKMEAIGRLAGGVAHDFNNLLTVILGRAQLLLQQLGPDDPHRRSVKLVQQTAERAGALTRQLLAFSRKQVLQPEVLDLNGVVAGIEKMLRRLIGEDLELITRFDRPLDRVNADPAQLEQVILNLAVNARDAMPHGGRLVLKTANVELDAAAARRHPEVRPGSYVMLEVSDTGVGMDAATQARIFEPFFTTKGPGKGTGLGLSTVFGIVRQSGGHIWVYSEPGKGSTFKIYLPRVGDAAESLGSGTPGPELRGGSETVLLVEDEDDLRDLVAEMLGSSGYTVLKAADGHEALRIGAQHAGPIHLLLTDVIMPQLSGRQVAERLAPARPETKVLYMSGYTDEVIGHHGVLEPGTALLQKPFTAEALARRVREVLDRPDRGGKDA